MSIFKKASVVFDTSADVQEYFESISCAYIKNSLIKVIDEKKTSLLFLLGDSGVGKTYMLNIIKNEFVEERNILFCSEPFFTPESFFHFLLQGYSNNTALSLTELRDKTVRLFKAQNNLIIIDEAQVLDEKIFELIRVLSDTGYFNFLISMHKDEGEVLLKKQHFFTRNHFVIILETLKKNEVGIYINNQLLMHGLGAIGDLFKRKQINLIMKLSKGNFRLIKQILKHAFLIMDYAKDNNHKRYTTPTTCVITMAAIDLGIINV